MSDHRLNRRNVLKGLGGAAGLGLAGGGAYLAIGPAAATATLDVDIAGTEVSNDRGDVDWVGIAAEKSLKWDGFDVPLKYIGFRHEITLVNSTIDGTVGWHQLYPKEGDFSISDRIDDTSSWDDWGSEGETVVAYTTDEDGKPNGTQGEIGADIEWQVITDGQHHDGYGYGDSGSRPFDAAEWAEYLSVTADGETKSRHVKVRTTLRFYTDDGEGNPALISPDDGVQEVSGQDTFAVHVTNEGGETTGSAETGNSTAG